MMGISRLVLCALLAGCITPNAVPCGELLCPDGTTCVDDLVCANSQQLEACNGLADGAACTFGGSAGTCSHAVCTPIGCGNGVLDPGEVCDGEIGVQSGRCASDCRRVEVCGNGVIDPEEMCDDANTNPADGCDACVATEWTATVSLGGQDFDPDVLAFQTDALALDQLDRVYFTDSAHGRVWRLDQGAVLTPVAGSGAFGVGGDGGLAVSAELKSPTSVAVDALGNVFIADTMGNLVRRVGIDGIITTVAGTSAPGYNGDGIVATAALLDRPQVVIVDGLGNLYIGDTGNGRVRRVDHATGVITTVATISATGLALSSSGELYVADAAAHQVSKVDGVGNVTLVAGVGTFGTSGDGGAATAAQLGTPRGLGFDLVGNLLIADSISGLRYVTSTGTIQTHFNTTSAAPAAVVVDSMGTFYLAGTGHIYRRDSVSLTLTSIVGNGGPDSSGDDGPARQALAGGACIAIDANDNLLVCDNDRVRVVDVAGVIRTAAGMSREGFSGDGGLPTSASLHDVMGVAVAPNGDRYIADTNNNRIRRISNGTIQTVAGNGNFSWNQGNGGPATSCPLASPRGIAIAPDGTFYIGAAYTDQIHHVDATQTITLFAGLLGSGYAGDNGPGLSARFGYVEALVTDATGNLYVADGPNHRIRKITPAGFVTTFAGTGTAGYSGDGGDALSAELNFPSALAFDSAGNLYVGDFGTNTVRRIDTTGVITTVVGTGTAGTSGDALLASQAEIDMPRGLAVDSSNRLYVSDTNRVRRVDLDGVIRTVVGAVDVRGTGPVAKARLVDPTALVRQPGFTLVAGGSYGVVERLTTSALDVIAGRYPHTSASGALARYREDSFGSVAGVAFDPVNNVVFLTESSAHRLMAVSIVDPQDADTWTIAPLANNAGTAGLANGPATTARFREPTGLYYDAPTKQLYVADTGNHVVRAIDLANGLGAATVRTIAGIGGVRGFFGDGGPPSSALLFEPRAMTVCSNGDLFIADTGNHRIRRIAGNTITTVVGVGVAASSGEGSPAFTFPIDSPRGVACDELGNLFASSRTSVRLLPANASGNVDGTGAVQTIYGRYPLDTYPENITQCLTGVAYVDATTIQVVDSCTGIMLDIRRAGVR